MGCTRVLIPLPPARIRVGQTLVLKLAKGRMIIVCWNAGPVS